MAEDGDERTISIQESDYKAISALAVTGDNLEALDAFTNEYVRASAVKSTMEHVMESEDWSASCKEFHNRSRIVTKKRDAHLPSGDACHQIRHQGRKENGE